MSKLTNNAETAVHGELFELAAAMTDYFFTASHAYPCNERLEHYEVARVVRPTSARLRNQGSADEHEHRCERSLAHAPTKELTMIHPPPLHLSRRVVSATAFLLILLLNACGMPEAPAVKAKPVRVQSVVLSNAAIEESFTGVVHARVETDLAFRVSGKIVRRLVDPGQHVVASEAIAQLDPEDYELAARAAKNQYEAAVVEARQAASDEARFRKLMADGFVSDANHERQKARADAALKRVEQARRQVDLARNRAGYAILRAPMSGVVTAVRFDVGQVVADGQPIATLAADGHREIVVDIPENRVAQVPGASTTATLWASDGKRFGVTLRELSPAASSATRTYRARFRVAPGAPPMQLGMTASIWLKLDNGKPSTTLPASALHQRDDGQPAVWLLDPVAGRVVLAPVEVTGYGQDAIRVAGLSSGALVVTAGTHKLDASLHVAGIYANGKPVNVTAPIVAARLPRNDAQL